MDKKSFVKGLFTGLGISLAGLIVAGGVIACNQKPVTTTPVVNKVLEERDSFIGRPRNVLPAGTEFVYNGQFNGSSSDFGTSYNNPYGGTLVYGGANISFSAFSVFSSSGYNRLVFFDSGTLVFAIGCSFNSVANNGDYYAYRDSSTGDRLFSSLRSLSVEVSFSSSINDSNLEGAVLYYFSIPYGLTATGINCSYSYTNNIDGSGYVDVTPDYGYSVNVNEWTDGTATLSGADYQRAESLAGGSYRLYFTNISQSGWSATFNGVPSSTQTITYNLSHCTATPLSVPYGNLDYHEVIRITPDVGYSLKHVVPVITGLSSDVYSSYVYYPQSDYIEIYANQVGVNPSVTCSAIERVDVNYDGLEHCSLLDVTPSPLIGFESRWRFVPDDGYNFLEGLSSPSYSVTPVSSASWSKEYGEGENLGKTILVCDATPNDGSMAFDIEAAAGVPVSSYLVNSAGKPLAYTEDSPLYWVDDNYRRSVTYNAMRGYRFVPPYIRSNTQSGISYTLSNDDHTLKVEYWNVVTASENHQLVLSPVLAIDNQAIGWGSTNVNFGSSWRPIQYVDNTAEYYTGAYMESNVLDFDSIVYSANGSMYDQLKLVFKVIGSNKFYVDGVDLNADGHLSTFRYFDHMEYRNTTTGESVIACSTKAMIVTANNETYVEIYPQELYWGNVQNSIISIYYDDGTTYDTATGVGLNLTASYILLNGGNVTGGSSQGNTGPVGFGGTYDPFVLIASAIGTATGFMGYMVLPGLTIGMLMLIPMIITLIIVVFKLVKK